MQDGEWWFTLNANVLTIRKSVQGRRDGVLASARAGEDAALLTNTSGEGRWGLFSHFCTGLSDKGSWHRKDGSAASRDAAVFLHSMLFLNVCGMFAWCSENNEQERKEDGRTLQPEEHTVDPDSSFCGGVRDSGFHRGCTAL